MFLLDHRMALAAKIGHASTTHRTREVFPGLEKIQEDTVTAQMRPLYEFLLRAALTALYGRITAMTVVTSDLVGEVDALLPFMDDPTEASRKIGVADHTRVLSSEAHVRRRTCGGMVFGCPEYAGCQAQKYEGSSSHSILSLSSGFSTFWTTHLSVKRKAYRLTTAMAMMMRVKMSPPVSWCHPCSDV